MKKVLFLITKSNWGGAQRYVYDLATSLRGRYAVAVACGGNGLLRTRLEESQISVISLTRLERDIRAHHDLSSFFDLYRLLKRERPDILHLNSSKAAGVGALAARLAGVPRIVFTVHGWPFLERRGPVSRALIWLASWMTAMLSHAVIVVSEHDLKIARKMPFVGSKTIRIYNGIDENFSHQLMPGSFIRDMFPRGVRITGTIGELNKNKNQIALIEQAKDDADMYVAICGEGENRRFLEEKIREYGLEKRVVLVGFVEPRMVLKGFDEFSLPSLKEGLPYVLVEAKAAGLPITANRVGGVGEILDAPDMGEFVLPRMVEKTSAVYEA